MVYKVKIIVDKGKSIDIECGEEYLKGLKEDLMDTTTNFLDLEEAIIRKSDISKVEIKQTSEK